mgnify:CR=1 FL=1
MSFGLNSLLKKFLPKRLFYRALIIVAAPIVLLQLIISVVFFDSIWIKANKGMTKSLVSEIVTIIDIYNNDIKAHKNFDRVFLRRSAKENRKFQQFINLSKGLARLRGDDKVGIVHLTLAKKLFLHSLETLVTNMVPMGMDLSDLNAEQMHLMSTITRLADGGTFESKVQLIRILKDNGDTITMQNSLTALQEKYTDSALELKQVATGWRFQVRADYAPNIAKLWEKKPPKYSRAVMETLALIAYRQPITRSEIEDVRGVAVSTQIIRALMDRNWVKIVGRRDVPGKPALFGTTKVFLDYFNLRKLSDLPELPASADLEQQGEKLKQQLKK